MIIAMTILNLTNQQWRKVDEETNKLAKEYAEGFNEEKYGNGEIYESHDGVYEQREYGGNFYTLESEIADIIEKVVLNGLSEDEIGRFEDEYRDFDPKYMVEGFHDVVISFESLLSDLLPNEWYVYYEDGDIWVARNWDSIDEIPEDVKHLVNE